MSDRAMEELSAAGKAAREGGSSREHLELLELFKVCVYRYKQEFVMLTFYETSVLCTRR